MRPPPAGFTDVDVCQREDMVNGEERRPLRAKPGRRPGRRGSMGTAARRHQFERWRPTSKENVMEELPAPKPLHTASEIAELPEVHMRHPWNPASDVYLRPLSMLAGLGRTVLTMARIPPGKESFVYHSHERDEEFVFILQGRGRAEIGDAVVEVGPGDFMGFAAPGVAHHLTNPFDEDLVYLMGGERSGMDVAYFPRLGKKLVLTPTSRFAVADADVVCMSFDDYLAKDDQPR
jgi:uncharacterized cupin superfamily protein